MSGDLESAIASTLVACKRSVRLSPNITEFDIELERLRAIRRRAERRYRRTKSLQDLRVARRTQKKIQRRIIQVQTQRWKSFCESLDPRKPLSGIWRTVRGLMTPVQQRSPFKALALHLKREELEVAEDFCVRIASGTASSDSALALDVPASRDPRMDVPFSIEELEAALALCKRSSSPGPDGVTYAALYHLGNDARNTLLEYFNELWRDGLVPEKRRSSRLVTLLKPAAYRPIALASCVGKLMERVILARLDWFLEHYKVYPEAMAGFRRGRSSIDCVIDLATFVQQQRRVKRICAALFLDVKGAYDNVEHGAILKALRAVGLGGRVYQWVRSYLSGRSFFVMTQDGPTSTHYTHRGVPQGGVLSPTLFNLTLIGLATSLPRSVQLSIYADDICIWADGVTRRHVRARLQKAADLTHSYLHTQGLEVSTSKCAIVAFTRRPMHAYPLSINGERVSYVKHHKFLGVVVDRDLSWSPHIRCLRKRLSAVAHILQFIGGKTWGTPMKSMLQLYNALFLGSLRYSLPVLSGTCRTNVQALQSLQAQALRICLGLPRCTSTAGTIAVARDHPMSTYITIETLRAHIRHLSRVPDHHLASMPSKRPHASFAKVVDADITTLPSNFTPPMRPLLPLWCTMQPRACLNIPGVTKKRDLPMIALQQLTLIYLHENYSDRMHIYTDGSVTTSGSAGAVVIPRLSMSIQFKLAHPTTSTATELTAIRRALQAIGETSCRRWAIFCDSKPALQSLQSALCRGPHEQLLTEVRLLYDSAAHAGHDIAFQWLPSHCGILGNERADTAARLAHQETEEVSIPLSRTDAARTLRKLARATTLSKWPTQDSTSARVNALDPHLQRPLPLGLPRSDATVLCRLWLGVAFTNAYSYLIGMAVSDACDVCDTPETIRHVLCECPRFSSERRQLSSALQKIDSRRPFSEEKILGHWPSPSSTHKATKALLCFLKATDLYKRL